MLKGKFFAIAIVFVLVFAALAGTSSASAAPKSALSVTLSIEKSDFSASEAVLVNVTVSNTGKNPVKVLKWFTPVEDVEESLFKVTRDGAAVNYTGAIYKRLAPTGNDYLNLKPGESFTRTVDLGQYYDLAETGAYEVEYNYETTALASNKVQISVEGRTIEPLAIVPDAVTGTTAYNKCTTTQQTSLVSARTQASTYSADALGYLNSNKQGSRYTTWFGVYDATRYNTVKTHFSSISNAMDTKPVTFDCSCKKKNVYAYVYSSQPYSIYLCGAFWAAPLTGTDSKGGTLIHEMSHFTVVAGTTDYVYGQAGAKSLAISNPSQAIMNADNHEYFAENTPTLP
jgi:peptidyl-Lys metalloendopeptidase